MVAGRKKITFFKKKKLFSGQRKAAWLWLDCAHCIKGKSRLLHCFLHLQMLKNFLCGQTSSAFFFFQRRTRTCKPFYAALSPETSEGTQTVSESVTSSGEEKKNCKLMVITCASACIHIMYVCVCEGATLQYCRKGCDSGGAHGYTTKKLSLTTDRSGSGRT